MPKVSVIVPVYNVADYLPKCLDSLLQQTLEDIEIILVNDGSSDDSQLVIDKYKNNYPEKIVALSKENGGAGDARNFGIAHAAGEYLAFVDGDDWVEYDMLELMYLEAQKKDADVVCCGMSRIFNQVVERTYFKCPEKFDVSVSENPEILKWGNAFSCNKIVRRSYWQEKGFQYPIQQYEDSALLYRVMAYANKVSCVDRAFYQYILERGDSCVHALNEGIVDIFKSCDFILSIKNHLPDTNGLYEVLDFLVVRHIMARFTVLATSREKEIIALYIRKAFTYLDEKVPSWKDSSNMHSGTKTKNLFAGQRLLRRHPKLSYFYYVRTPFALRCFVHKIFGFYIKRKTGVTQSGKEEKRRQNSTAQKSACAKYGLALLEAVQNELAKIDDLQVFVTSEMLLDVTVNKTLSNQHESVQLGVLGAEQNNNHEYIREKLEAFGLKLMHRYWYNNKIIEEHYKIGNTMLNINYFETKRDACRVFCAYKTHGKKYKKQHCDVLEFAMPCFEKIIKTAVNKHTLNIPENASQVLEAYFGSSWQSLKAGRYSYPASSKGCKVLHGECHYIRGKYINFTTMSEAWYQIISPDALEMAKQLHAYNLALLKEFKRICTENNISYFLGESTLLGALRHGGFIPWDTTVDVVMFRQDYDKFLKLAPQFVDTSKFEVQHWTCSENYWLPYALLRSLDSSEFAVKKEAHVTNHNGPFLSIYPLDSVPACYSEEQVKQKKEFKKMKRALAFRQKISEPTSPSSELIIQKTKNMAVQDFYDSFDAIAHQYENEQNKYVVNLSSAYGIKKETFPVAWFGEGKSVQFEGEEFIAPVEAEKILACTYGQSYMDLPPVTQRKSKSKIAKA